MSVVFRSSCQIRDGPDDRGSLGFADAEQGLGALDLRSVVFQSDRDIAGLEPTLVAVGLGQGYARADYRSRQPTGRGTGQGASDIPNQVRRQQPGIDH